MASFASLFGRLGAARPDPETVARLKGWTLELLGSPADTALAINEIVCVDPGCPGTETVILIMAAGEKTRACKIAKALADVTRDDLAAALEPDRKIS